MSYPHQPNFYNTFTRALTDRRRYVSPDSPAFPSPSPRRRHSSPLPPSTVSGTCSANGAGGGVCTENTRDPKKWGPHLWMFMHYAAANYPENPSPQHQQDMMDWLRTLPTVIPCGSCSHHFRQHIQRNQHRLPEICRNRENLFVFLVDTHNKVNQRTYKGIMSIHEAKDMYDY